MALNIIEKTDKSLLSRTDVLAEIDFKDAAPSRKDVKAELASKLNSKDDLIVVRSINTSYGFKKAKVFASVYKDKKSLEKINKKYLLERELPKEKKEAEEPKKEETEETPKEEPKEEKKEASVETKEEPPKEEQKETTEETKEEKAE